jgi:hypothetical protein
MCSPPPRHVSCSAARASCRCCRPAAACGRTPWSARAWTPGEGGEEGGAGTQQGLERVLCNNSCLGRGQPAEHARPSHIVEHSMASHSNI